MDTDTPRRGRPPMLRTEAPIGASGYLRKEDMPSEIQADTGPRKSARKPFGAMQQKLAYPSRVGFHRHWFNDVTGRIDSAKEAGYEHVIADGKPMKKVVGTAEGGGALMGFLMEIPQEWYDEDMAAQQREIDEKEKSIKERQFDGSRADQDSVYGKVSIGQGK